MDDRRAPDRDRAANRRRVERRSFLGAVGGLSLATLAGCTTTEKPSGTLIEGDAPTRGEGTTVPPETATPTPGDVFSLSKSALEANEDGYMTYTATVENTADRRWIATLHARLQLGNPVTPEEEASATPLTPRSLEGTRRINLAPGETRDVTITFDVTDTVYFSKYRSSSFDVAWSDLVRP